MNRQLIDAMVFDINDPSTYWALPPREFTQEEVDNQKDVQMKELMVYKNNELILLTGGGTKKELKDRWDFFYMISEKSVDSLKELAVLHREAVDGITGEMALAWANMLMEDHKGKIPIHLIVACISAVGQVRENLAKNELISELQDIFELNTSDKDKKTIVNLTAVKMIGQVFCAWLHNLSPRIKKANEKNGNIFMSLSMKESEASRIVNEQRNALDGFVLPPPVDARILIIATAVERFFTENTNGTSAEALQKAKLKIAATFKN